MAIWERMWATGIKFRVIIYEKKIVKWCIIGLWHQINYQKCTTVFQTRVGNMKTWGAFYHAGWICTKAKKKKLRNFGYKCVQRILKVIIVKETRIFLIGTQG